jgi:hypothetical protein
VTDGYICTVSYLAPGSRKRCQDRQHAIHTTLGLPRLRRMPTRHKRGRCAAHDDPPGDVGRAGRLVPRRFVPIGKRRDRRHFRRLVLAASVALTGMVTGCAQLQMGPPAASTDNILKAKASGISPVSLGEFALAPGKEPGMGPEGRGPVERRLLALMAVPLPSTSRRTLRSSCGPQACWIRRRAS